MSEAVVKLIRLDQICLDTSCQARETISDAVVSEYAEQMRHGEQFPAVSVVCDGERYYPWDGWHRIKAALAAGLETIQASVTRGALTDAQWLALSANKGHVHLRRTNADKQRAVRLALEMHPEYSNVMIAEHCGVSDEMVAGVRRKQPPKFGGSSHDQPETRIGRDGKTRRVPTRTAAAQDATETDDSDESDPIETVLPSTPVVILPESPDETEATGDTDDWGIPIQPHAKDAFAAKHHFRELLKIVKQLRKQLADLADMPGGLFLTLPGVMVANRVRANANGEDVIRWRHSGLEQLLKDLENAEPHHTVCPYEYADTEHPKQCRTCLNKGWTPLLGSSIPPVCIRRAKAAFGVEDSTDV